MSVNPYEPSRIPEPVISSTMLGDAPQILAYDLTIDDLVKFNVDHQRHSFRAMAGCLFGASSLLVPVAVGAYLLANASALEWDEQLFLILFAVVSFLMLVSMAIWSAWHGVPAMLLMPILIRYLLTRGDTSSLAGRYTLSISPSELVERAPKSEHRFAISAVQKLVWSDQAIYIYMSPIQAIVVPMRAFAEPAAAEAFIRVLQQHSGVTPLRQ